jgi:hypothetical protein
MVKITLNAIVETTHRMMVSGIFRSLAGSIGVFFVFITQL